MTSEDQPVTPRHVLCALGSGLDFGAVERIAKEVGGPDFTFDDEYSEQASDPRMTSAFRNCMASLSFTDADWEAVEAHDSVAYVMGPPMTREGSLDVSRRLLAVAAALLRGGATAIKNESNALTHGRDQWLTLADRAAGPDGPAVVEALYRAWVKRPIGEDGLLMSCGLHLLGEPDVEVFSRSHSPEAVIELIDAFGLYQLTEARARQLRDDEGFRVAPGAPRWLLQRRPCQRYESDDFFFNPYGYWRLTPAEPAAP